MGKDQKNSEQHALQITSYDALLKAVCEANAALVDYVTALHGAIGRNVDEKTLDAILYECSGPQDATQKASEKIQAMQSLLAKGDVVGAIAISDR